MSPAPAPSKCSSGPNTALDKMCRSDNYFSRTLRFLGGRAETGLRRKFLKATTTCLGIYVATNVCLRPTTRDCHPLVPPAPVPQTVPDSPRSLTVEWCEEWRHLVHRHQVLVAAEAGLCLGFPVHRGASVRSHNTPVRARRRLWRAAEGWSDHTWRICLDSCSYWQYHTESNTRNNRSRKWDVLQCMFCRTRRDGTGRDGTGRDGTGRTGRDGTGRDVWFCDA